ncbi:hypothetical protein SV7mr_43610 [Stieleria bergensis]|uniref:Secreted protein containing DUF1552 n=2 Tax=Stieleria bergensis TaxID=2528025 RepID=A0A517T095_9BACT|nr:hypothetical protein SV7mr_43610 [Planctomycetes bacterium SV_7m_r]
MTKTNQPASNKGPQTSMPNKAAAVVGSAMRRRSLLRGSGVAMALPWLSAMQPAGQANADQVAEKQANPRRFVAMTLGLGLLSGNLNPEQEGRGYESSRYLKSLEDIRDDYTIISGSSHPEVTNGHRAEASILTATPIGNSGSAKNTVSLDQLLAKQLGRETRFPALVLSLSGSQSPSYTDTGSMISAESSPAKLFTSLFVDQSPTEQAQQARRISEGRSIMDVVGQDAKRLQQQLGAGDRNRLDEFFTSVRELERFMASNQQWAKLPKPKVDMKMPVQPGGNDLIGRQAMMMQVMKLALQTDSTRFITLHVPGGNPRVPIEGVQEGYHTLSHHGRNEDKMEQLSLIEEQIVGTYGDFLRDLGGVDEPNGSLLDHTSVLLTSNLGNASSHDNRNMPVLIGGGGFRHGQHLAFSKTKNYPLANLYVSILQQTGLSLDRFSSGTTTMNGLEPTTA